MNITVYQRIVEWLEQAGVQFKTLQHDPTYTSEESASARGEDISIGAKALLLKVDGDFALFVISAAKKVDSKKIRNYLSAKKSRFASAEELMTLTGLVPGSVPPFGRPIFDLDLYADASVFDNERVAFNAGSLTDSIILASDDYRRVANPIVFDFSQW